jgi:elongation factor Ts
MLNSSCLKELRELTSASITDCKKALEESNGDMNKAVEWLRKKGVKPSIALRSATEGVITSYIHTGGKVGVLLEVNCQSDFLARSDMFKDFCKDVALHIAGRDPYPMYISDEEIPSEVVNKERAFQIEKAREAKKPENIVAKIADGAVSKWKKDICLLDQEFVKDPSKTIKVLLADIINKSGEKVVIRRFARYSLGEGLKKEEVDFSKEVKELTAGI